MSHRDTIPPPVSNEIWKPTAIFHIIEETSCWWQSADEWHWQRRWVWWGTLGLCIHQLNKKITTHVRDPETWTGKTWFRDVLFFENLNHSVISDRINQARTKSFRDRRRACDKNNWMTERFYLTIRHYPWTCCISDIRDPSHQLVGWIIWSKDLGKEILFLR